MVATVVYTVQSHENYRWTDWSIWFLPSTFWLESLRGWKIRGLGHFWPSVSAQSGIEKLSVIIVFIGVLQCILYMSPLLYTCNSLCLNRDSLRASSSTMLHAFIGYELSWVVALLSICPTVVFKNLNSANNRYRLLHIAFMLQWTRTLGITRLPVETFGF